MISHMYIKVTVLLLFQFFSITLLFAQAPLNSAQPDNGTAQFPAASTYVNANLSYSIIDAPNNTFCYDVYVGGRLMIHPTSVPGLPGNEGFKTRDDSVKVAEMGD